MTINILMGWMLMSLGAFGFLVSKLHKKAIRPEFGNRKFEGLCIVLFIGGLTVIILDLFP